MKAREVRRNRGKSNDLSNWMIERSRIKNTNSRHKGTKEGGRGEPSSRAIKFSETLFRAKKKEESDGITWSSMSWTVLRMMKNRFEINLSCAFQFILCSLGLTPLTISYFIIYEDYLRFGTGPQLGPRRKKLNNKRTNRSDLILINRPVCILSPGSSLGTEWEKSLSFLFSNFPQHFRFYWCYNDSTLPRVSNSSDFLAKIIGSSSGTLAKSSFTVSKSIYC